MAVDSRRQDKYILGHLERANSTVLWSNEYSNAYLLGIPALTANWLELVRLPNIRWMNVKVYGLFSKGDL